MGLAVWCGDGTLGGGGGGRVKGAGRVAGRDWEMRTDVQAITEVLGGFEVEKGEGYGEVKTVARNAIVVRSMGDLLCDGWDRCEIARESRGVRSESGLDESMNGDEVILGELHTSSNRARRRVSTRFDLARKISFFALDRMEIQKKVRVTQSHAHRNICILHHLLELLEADLAVAVLVRFHDCFVYDLHVQISSTSPQWSHLSLLQSPRARS